MAKMTSSSSSDSQQKFDVPATIFTRILLGYVDAINKLPEVAEMFAAAQTQFTQAHTIFETNAKAGIRAMWAALDKLNLAQIVYFTARVEVAKNGYYGWADFGQVEELLRQALGQIKAKAKVRLVRKAALLAEQIVELQSAIDNADWLIFDSSEEFIDRQPAEQLIKLAKMETFSMDERIDYACRVEGALDDARGFAKALKVWEEKVSPRLSIASLEGSKFGGRSANFGRLARNAIALAKTDLPRASEILWDINNAAGVYFLNEVLIPKLDQQFIKDLRSAQLHNAADSVRFAIAVAKDQKMDLGKRISVVEAALIKATGLLDEARSEFQKERDAIAARRSKGKPDTISATAAMAA